MSFRTHNSGDDSDRVRVTEPLVSRQRQNAATSHYNPGHASHMPSTESRTFDHSQNHRHIHADAPVAAIRKENPSSHNVEDLRRLQKELAEMERSFEDDCLALEDEITDALKQDQLILIRLEGKTAEAEQLQRWLAHRRASLAQTQDPGAPAVVKAEQPPPRASATASAGRPQQPRTQPPQQRQLLPSHPPHDPTQQQRQPQSRLQPRPAPAPPRQSSVGGGGDEGYDSWDDIDHEAPPPKRYVRGLWPLGSYCTDFVPHLLSLSFLPINQQAQTPDHDHRRCPHQ